MDDQTTPDAPFGAWTPFVTPLYPVNRIAVDEQGGDER